jgi:hypothetical protein
MKLNSYISRIAEIILRKAEGDYQYIHDPDHRNKPHGNFWETEKGWSNDPKHNPKNNVSNGRQKHSFSIGYATDEDGETDYDKEEALRAIAWSRDLGITSDREIGMVATDANGKVVGGTFTSWDGENYTFDIVVDKSVEGTGLGSDLLDNSIRGFNSSEYKDINPDATMKVDVVSPTMRGMLEKRGFEVKQLLGPNRWLMEQPSEEEIERRKSKPIVPRGTIAETRKMNAQYLNAIKIGDMETVQRMVEDRAKKSGYTIKGYHGTNDTFNKVDMNKGAMGSFWFSGDKEHIQGGESGAVGTNIIKELYIKINKPAGWDEYDRYSMFELARDGYDGVVLKNDDGHFTGFVWRKPSQVKSADPIARDDKGNIIPLSQRFNPKANDIRY